MRLSRLLLSAIFVLSPMAAHASIITFSFTGGLENGSFSINTLATPVQDSFGITYNTIAYTNSVFSQVTFYSVGEGGGFTDTNTNSGGYGGPAVFTGPLTNPTFESGPYSFTLFRDPTTPVEYALVTGGAAPEPSSLVLLGTGVLGVAGAIRRRLRK